MSIINNEIKNNPKQIKEYQLIWLCNLLKNNKKIYCSPKANGTYYQLNKIYKNYIFECEYIQQFDLYLVFDIHDYPSTQNNNYFNRMKYICSLHSQKPNVICNINDLSSIDAYIKEQNMLLSNYIKNSSDKIKWFPKSLFIICFSDYNLLDLLDTTVNFCYNTDGWIINLDNHRHIYKYKPKNHLTIDLYYDGCDFLTFGKNKIKCIMSTEEKSKNIYRCYWNDILHIWEAKEIRNDKLYPNPSNIVEDIQKLHLNYWNSSSLKSKLNNITYYTHDDVQINDPIIINILELKKKIIIHLLSSFDLSKKNILDIGCGKGSLIPIIKVNNYSTYYGIDIDPICLSISEYKFNNNKNTFIWNNFMSTELTKLFDTVFLINSIHYFLDDLNSFFTKLVNSIHNNSSVIILFLDSEKIQDFNYLDQIIIKNISHDTYHFKYPWISNTFVEKIINMSCLIRYMEKYNLNYKILQCNATSENNFINTFLGFHSLLVLTK